ncbi:MAG: sulfite exporter TauE/SafE family protein [Nitrospirota bacterium]|nr:sulfite exporter TauE/SafE family protein [Nitrospirota bacterium]MDH5767628.1 sulfite exporter TauE/SafE family protein [Nitrospirota bacterium]
MIFPESGIDVFPLIPPIVALCVSFFTSMGGVSGAFLLLPFQVSILGFVSPAVSPTNLIFNIVAIPGGVLRFIREGRMAWPLTWVIIMATLPGVFIGCVLRISYLPDPETFKVFVGCVLLYIGCRITYDTLFRPKKVAEKAKALDAKFKQRVKEIKEKQKSKVAAGLPPEAVVKTIKFSPRQIIYEFYGETYSFNVLPLFIVAFIVGIIGGTYGIGGGAIIAPFLVAFFRLPVHTIAGASLMGTFLTSIVGVIFYVVVAPMYAYTGLDITPDWLLGFLFGIGGTIGIYFGARAQKYFPAKFIKLTLAFIIVFLGLSYVL